MIKIKNAKVINTGLILVSLLMGLLLCELVLRLVSHESDIMPVIPTPDPILGWRLPPFQSGLDARGFRNITAEGDFPIVFIGDSMIYGSGLPLRDAVPQQMSLMLREKVYNMGGPAYGPIQYYQLFKESRNMHPRKTIIAIFMGNNLLKAYFMAYQHEPWKWLLNESGDDYELQTISHCSLPVDYTKIDFQYLDPEKVLLHSPNKGFIRAVHEFLSSYSAIYANSYERIVKPLVQKRLELPGVYFYSTAIDTVFVPGGNLRYQDLQDNRVRRGLLITKKIIELLATEQRGKHDLLFIILPTKENVYYNFLKSNNIALPNEFECCVHYEREIYRWLSNVIKSHGFEFIDVFPPLEKSATNGVLLYNHLSDCHLNAKGSQIVATTIGNAMKNN